MSRKKRVQNRRGYSDELKQEAVQMLLARPFGHLGGLQPGSKRHEPALSLEVESPGNQRTDGDQTGSTRGPIGGRTASREAGA